MIIGIDYRFAITSNRGIAYYLKSVVAALAELDHENSYYLYVDREVKLAFPPNFHVLLINCKNLVLFEQFALPRRAKKDGVQLLWYPSNSGPIFLATPIKLVTTIHDLVSFNYRPKFQDFLTFRGVKSALAELYRAFALKKGLKRINEIITISSFSAEQISEQLHRKATVIENHVHPLVVTDTGNHILAKLNISPKNYIYTMTGSARHKNLAGYIKVFESGEELQPLVISGVNDPRVIKKYKSRLIIFTGDVTESEKATLYANASAFLFLSHQEGFGLPILEAMQFQIPIISSNSSALPFVVGDAGILIDPKDISEIRRALKNINHNHSVTMKEKQKTQYQRFSNWSIAAKSHLALFLSLGDVR